ncbi:MAG: ATP-dependent DNA helicase RecG [Patescibacteria group bacterium]
MNRNLLDKSIADFSGVGEKTAAKLAKLGLLTVRDLIFYFPRRYEDYMHITPIGKLADVISNSKFLNSNQFSNSNSQLTKGDAFTIKGDLLGIANKKTRRRGFTVTEGVVTDESGSIKIVWFNQPFLAKMLQPGSELILSGKVSFDSFQQTYVMESPTRSNRPRIIPVYGETAGLSSFFISKLFAKAKTAVAEVEEWLPGEFTCHPELVSGSQKKELDPRVTVRPRAAQGRGEPEDDTILLKSCVDNKTDGPSDYPTIGLSLMPLREAILALHEPKSTEQLETARRRLAFDELFMISLRANVAKVESSKLKAKSIKIDIEEVKDLISKLPFELTVDQKKALWQILKDLEKDAPMSRLLNGDVGSGKTVVAAIAAFIAKAAGQKTLLMVPTSILASQHYETFCKLFENHEDITIGLKTSDRACHSGLDPESSNKELDPEWTTASVQDDIIRIKNPKKHNTKYQIPNTDIIIGTQALIQKDVSFENVGLVITDEQHRFGVKQREALQKLPITNYQLPNNDQLPISNTNEKEMENENCKLIGKWKMKNGNSQKVYPHFLSMTATPIPRTLHLALFGDLDISIIREKPSNRKEIKTRFVEPHNRGKAYEFIRAQIKAGRQCFVICPLIEEKNKNVILNGSEESPEVLRFSHDDSQTLFEEERKSVKAEFEKLKIVFPEIKIGILHGKMKAREKEEIMADFAAGKINLLVSTSVVEVGVDIPNASVMMIEDAERFGLAQIHQFRGRVGRGGHQSFCFLFSNTQSEKAINRLRGLEAISDGFKLAELDLEMRGPGAVFGTEQSGMLDLKMASLSDSKLIHEASEAAKSIAPDIEKYPKLMEKLAQFESSRHLE